MATSQATVDYILDQLSDIADITTRKMFGEYALYAEGRVIALVCDDTLFVKITEPGKEFAGKHYAEGAPYPGAKPWMQINEEQIEDREWITGLIRITTPNVPIPKPKKPKKR